jgi:hypothetical protein
MRRINWIVSFNYKYFDMELTYIVWLSYWKGSPPPPQCWHLLTMNPGTAYPVPTSRPIDRQGAMCRPTTSRVISHQPDAAASCFQLSKEIGSCFWLSPLKPKPLHDVVRCGRRLDLHAVRQLPWRGIHRVHCVRAIHALTVCCNCRKLRTLFID